MSCSGLGVTVEEGATIRSFSHLAGAHVGKNAIVGPYARLRPGAKLEEGVHIGNFVEVKEALIEAGAKANHLSYIGDARVGAGANIGAGTITCNYDGAAKHRTDIGKGAFIGSNSALVAPVKIGDGAYVGSGSVITADVRRTRWRLGRGRQTVKEGWAKRLRELKSLVKKKDKYRLLWHQVRLIMTLILSHPDMHCDFPETGAGAITSAPNAARGRATCAGLLEFSAVSRWRGNSSTRSSASNTAATIPPASPRSSMAR